MLAPLVVLTDNVTDSPSHKVVVGAEMLQVNNGSTFNVNVTVESQPVAEVNTSVYVPAVVNVCAPKV